MLDILEWLGHQDKMRDTGRFHVEQLLGSLLVLQDKAHNHSSL